MTVNTTDDNNINKAAHYNSFSGTDIVASISVNPLDVIPADGENAVLGAYYTIGNLQTISISAHRDLAPVRAIGYDSPKTYKKGTRTVSGTIVFVKIHKDKIQDLFKNYVESAHLDVRGFRSFDRTLPFNVQLSQSNEYGVDTSSAYLIGVSLMDSGTVVSINDIYTEQTYSYVAREYLDFGMDATQLINDVRIGVNTVNGLYEKITNE